MSVPRGHALNIAAAGGIAFALASVLGDWSRLAAIGAGGGLASAAVMVLSGDLVAAWRERRLIAQALRLFWADPVAHLVTDSRGRVRAANPAARHEFPQAERRISGVLTRISAAPDEETERLLDMLEGRTALTETMRTGGGALRLTLSRIGPGLILWRVERPPAEAGRLGRIASLTVAADGQVTAASPVAEELLGRCPSHLRDVLDDGVESGRARVRTASGPVIRSVVALAGEGGRREILLLEPAVAGGRPAAGSLAETFAALPVPALVVSPDGAIGSANGAARALFGIAGDESVPPLYDLVEGIGRPISEWLADASLGRGLLRPEFVRAGSGGRELYLQITLGRVEEAAGVRLIAILNDATELKTLEAKYVQSQKMQAIGQLAGGVAHDFNNLLTAIGGHCDLLLLRHDEGDPDYADLKQIEANANRAASLVGQLLAFSRKQTLSTEPLDLCEAISDLTHLLNRLVGEKVRLEFEHVDGPAMVRGDRRQLEQVIMNLVLNARDSMPDGGQVAITTRHERLAAPLLRDRAEVPAGDYVRVTVEDEGRGIAPDRLSKIFEPFYTTKRAGEGTGLGLSTAYGIVKQTGGFIFADSRPGEGTRFTLLFPALDERDAAAERVAAEAPKRRPATRRGEGVVLLVEDEGPVRAFASRALRLKGYTVIEAENAEEALALLDDPQLRVDVFVTDVVMPGLDGPTWVRRALEARPETRVVFVSGYSEEAVSEKQSRVPNSVFLPKPFSLADLAAAVHSQMSATP